MSPTALKLLVIVFSASFVAGQNTSFAFPSFINQIDSILPLGDSLFSRQDTAYIMNSLGTANSGGSCGRIFYKNPVQMIDSTGAVASFQTAFTISFQTPNASATTCGDGMAFTFVNASALQPNYNRGGGGFCLIDFSANPPDQNMFAVEFDSFRNTEPNFDDPVGGESDSHIGVDLNNGSLGTADICANGNFMPTFCSLTEGRTRPQGFCGQKGIFAAWIDYSSDSRKLEVRIREGNSTDDAFKPAMASITVPNLPLGNVFTVENMYVGFSASTGANQESHRLLSWKFATTGLVTPSPAPSPLPGSTSPAPLPLPGSTSPTPSPMPSSTSTSSNKTSAALVAGICVSVLSCAIFGLLCFCKRRRTKASRELLQYSSLGELALTETSWTFTYRELSRITKNFSDSELLASGGFGDVFKGTLASGALVAVKRIKRRKDQDVKSFLAEATSMRQIRHRNLLQLRGWCVSKEGLMLVFDFMSNSSLDKWIHGTAKPELLDSSPCSLSWDARRNILAGVASGLAYLHGDWVQCVLHRDIKSSNVMLDENFNAYLGDFGLARLVDHQMVDKTTLLAGTLGYMAPEMHYTGRATKETDVYAFGVLVLEVVCGRRPLDSQVADPGDFVLVDCAWRAHEAGDLLRVADRSLVEGEIPEMLKSVLQVGLLCCHPNPAERLSMRDVNQWFFDQDKDGGAMELPPLPATKPYIAQYLNIMSEDFLESGVTGASSSSQTASSSLLTQSSVQTSVLNGAHEIDNSALSVLSGREFGAPR